MPPSAGDILPLVAIGISRCMLLLIVNDLQQTQDVKSPSDYPVHHTTEGDLLLVVPAAVSVRDRPQPEFNRTHAKGGESNSRRRHWD